MSKISELTGIGIPVLWASAAAYGFFLWLDRNASAKAISTINSWLRSRSYERLEMRNAIVSLFDRIYTYPLWKPRAIFWSAIYSTTFFLMFMIYHISAHLATLENTFAAWWSFLVAVVLSDYISLFVVRSYLTVARGNLLISLCLALLYGSLVVFWTYRIGVVLAIKGMDNLTRFLIVTMVMDMSNIGITDVNRIMENWGLFFVPAIVVHLWFPLFALGALGVRLIYFLFSGVHLAQWFLKQGDKHPLQAIGIVAAAVVFVDGDLDACGTDHLTPAIAPVFYIMCCLILCCLHVARKQRKSDNLHFGNSNVAGVSPSGRMSARGRIRALRDNRLNGRCRRSPLTDRHYAKVWISMNQPSLTRTKKPAA